MPATPRRIPRRRVASTAMTKLARLNFQAEAARSFISRAFTAASSVCALRVSASICSVDRTVVS
jgi:hypothetical protein